MKTCNTNTIQQKITPEIMTELQLHRLVGIGTYGAVYSIKNNNADVVKLTLEYPAELQHSLLNVDHPSIVLCKSAVWNDKHKFWCITYERAYTNLTHYIRYYNLSAICSISTVLHNIISGLYYLHSLNIAHFDISSSNILVFRNHVKISDFDLASNILDITEYKHFRHEIVTVSYRPPELLFNKRSSSGAICGYFTDIWSFGVIMLQLIMRANPFYNYMYASNSIDEPYCTEKVDCLCNKCHVKDHMIKLLGDFSDQTNSFVANDDCKLLCDLNEYKKLCKNDEDKEQFDGLVTLIKKILFSAPQNRPTAETILHIMS